MPVRASNSPTSGSIQLVKGWRFIMKRISLPSNCRQSKACAEAAVNDHSSKPARAILTLRANMGTSLGSTTTWGAEGLG